MFSSLILRRWVLNFLLLLLFFGSLFFFYLCFPTSPRQIYNFQFWLFSYEFGLIKRGLVGTILNRFVFSDGTSISIDQMSIVIRFVSSLTFALAFFASLYSLRVVWKSSSEFSVRLLSLLSVGILIGTPIGILYYVSNGFYLEVTLLFLMFFYFILLLFRPSAWIAFFVLIPVCVLSCLSHEIALLSTLPFLLLIYYIVYRSFWPRSTLVLSLSFTFLFCLGLVLYASSRSPALASSQFSIVSSRAGWPLESDGRAFLVLSRTLKENVNYTLSNYFHAGRIAPGGKRVLWSLMMIMPALVFFLLNLYRQMDRKLFLLSLLIYFMPFGLYILGDDTYRWNVILILQLGLLNQLYLQRISSLKFAIHWPLLVLGICAILIAICLPYPYFMNAPGYPI